MSEAGSGGALERFADGVSRRWRWVLLAWAVLVAAVYLAAPRWDDVTHDGDFAYLPEEVSSIQGEKLREAAFPEATSKSEVVLVVARPDGPLGPDDYRVADRLAAALSPGDESGPVLSVASHRTEVVGKKLVSAAGDEGQALLIIARLRSELMAIDNMKFIADVYARLERVRGEGAFPPGLRLGVTGSAAIGYDMLEAASQSIRNTDRATIVLVIVILLLVYRAPGLVLVPLTAITVSVIVAMGLVATVACFAPQLGIDFKIFKTTKIFVVVILFGGGTDYCLFLIARYKEELHREASREKAVGRALARVGDALAASALTTVIGLATMVLADYGKFRNSGPAIALCLLVTLAAAMTLAPALLRAGGRVVFWPFAPRPVAEGVEGDDDVAAVRSAFDWFWQPLASAIVARPGWILLASLLVLAPLAWRGTSVEVTYDLLAELRADCPSVEGTRLLRQYFPAGETSPVTVLAYNPAGGFDRDDGRLKKIQELSDDLYALEYRGSRPITSVRSLVEPLGEPAEKFGLLGGLRKGVLRGHQRTKSTYLAQSPEYAGKVTRLDLVFQYDPFSLESIRLLDFVDDHLYAIGRDPGSDWQGTEFFFLGTTAGIRDLRLVTSSDLLLIQQLVPIAVLAVLMVILRRPIVCVYLILSVLLGYYVTIGVSEAFFARLYGDTFQGLDWKVPMFLFVILIAVGQDYNVYLVTRVFEEQRRLGVIEGLRTALIRTGGIITSCGVIMAGTFAAIGTGTLRAMHELGFALSLGVLLDTLVIRTVMVPAFLVLWDRVSARWTRDQGQTSAQPGAGASGDGETPPAGLRGPSGARNRSAAS